MTGRTISCFYRLQYRHIDIYGDTVATDDIVKAGQVRPPALPFITRNAAAGLTIWRLRQ